MKIADMKREVREKLLPDHDSSFEEHVENKLTDFEGGTSVCATSTGGISHKQFAQIGSTYTLNEIVKPEPIYSDKIEENTYGYNLIQKPTEDLESKDY